MITHDLRLEQLENLFYDLVKIIRYDNTYAYLLLKEITSGRSTTIELDGFRLYLEADIVDGEYILSINKNKKISHIQFITTSLTLRKIMAGLTTIDGAIIKNKIFVLGTFNEIYNIHKLAICLLSEGPLNNNLRCLWQHFNDTWNNNEFPLGLIPIEDQVPDSGYLISQIPENILHTII
jgi:hypothetical protein